MVAPSFVAPSSSARFAALWSRHVWQPRATWLTRLLTPLSWLYAFGVARLASPLLGVSTLPVVVVGNWVVGGAGKTPTVIALVQALAARGWTVGVVSRGYGREQEAGVVMVGAASTPAQAGDEPLLIHRRTGVPVCVALDRRAALDALQAAFPAVDVVVADDGLQHTALARVAEVWVFDDRGVGNGRLLPAGPLRAPLPRTVPAHAQVLYTAGGVSTDLPGRVAVRQLGHALPLRAWWSGDTTAAMPLEALPREGLHALAGIAAPEKFFAMLEAMGLRFVRIPQPDHADYTTLPWPASVLDVLVTEKDAVKLQPTRISATRVWVVPLDFALPDGLVDAIVASLPRRRQTEAHP